MNQKVMLLLGLAVPLFAVACNSNPVVVPTQEDTPLLMQQDPTDQNKLVDLLWMIDDSGSMAQEQIGIIKGIQGLAEKLAPLDFRLAVTSTDGVSGFISNCPSGKCHPGEFRNRASLGLSDSGKYSVATIEELFYTAVDNCLVPTADKSALKAAFRAKIPYCDRGANAVSDSDPSEPEPRPDCTQQEKDQRNGIEQKLSDFNQVAGEVKLINPLMPSADQLRTVGPILTSKGYSSSEGVLTEDGKKSLQKDLACLTLVGTTGWGVEKGLNALVKSVDPNGPNQGDPLVLPARSGARTVTVVVTDENDCTHEPIIYKGKKRDLNEGPCLAVACNLFNMDGIPDSENPLVSPKVLFERFVNNLAVSRGGSSSADYDYKTLASIVTVTGTPLPKPGQTLGGYSPKAATLAGASCSVPEGYECSVYNDTAPDKSLRGSLPDWKHFWLGGDGHPMTDPVPLTTYCEANSGPNQTLKASSKIKLDKIACDNAWGTSVSGDRYYDFAAKFPNHFPENRGDLGAMCQTNFSSVFKALNDFVTGESGDCISSRLVSCESGAKAGDPCGPSEAQGVCVAYDEKSKTQVNKGLFCSASVQPTMTCHDKTKFAAVKKYCVEGTEGATGGPESCIITQAVKGTNAEVYNLKNACPSSGSGVQFALDPTIKAEILGQGCSVNLNITGFVGSGSSDKK